MTPIPIDPEIEGETTQGGFLNKRASCSLKFYFPKRVRARVTLKFDKYIIMFLYDLMDHQG